VVGEAVGVEQKGVAGGEDGGGGGEARLGQGADEEAAGGGQEVGCAAGPEFERRGVAARSESDGGLPGDRVSSNEPIPRQTSAPLSLNSSPQPS
jgi:hypothetical protein